MKAFASDGRFNYVSASKEVDLRISLPTVHGEKIVMRLLEKTLPFLTARFRFAWFGFAPRTQQYQNSTWNYFNHRSDRFW
jgi:type II secretory ATPase GspE/PulE/Tfp pilus assembly ATPase PilB-like protein